MERHKVDLCYSYGYKWVGNDTIKAKGWIISEQGTSIRGEALIDYFQGIETAEQLTSLLNKTGGHFAVVINNGSEIVAAVDRGRSIALYFRTDRGCIEVSDSGFFLAGNEDKSSELNRTSIQEYIAAGYVTGNKTLLNNVLQLGAGEIATLSQGKASISTYFQYLPSEGNPATFDKLVDKFVDTLESDYRTIIEGLNGRTVVIPLSGGYDSRSIASMLKRMGYQNVVCYSFGKPNNHEMLTSKAVAETLGFRWIFVETTAEMVRDFAQSDEFLQYVHYAANASSFYIIQDFFAVKHLKANGQIPDDAVFMPGHSGDTLGGSNFLELLSGKETKQEMIEIIINHRYDVNKAPREFTHKIREELHSQYGQYNNPAAWFDYWCMKEWNPKMFANGVRVYEFFGYEYFLPLWSKNMLSLFANLPIEYRVRKELYEFTLENKIFSPLGVNLNPNRRKDFSYQLSAWQKTKNLIKHWLPKTLIYSLFSHEPINSKLYCTQLVANAKQRRFKIKQTGTNSIKAQWYARHIQQQYKPHEKSYL